MFLLRLTVTTQFVSLGWRIRKDTRGTADVAGYKERVNVKTTRTTTSLSCEIVTGNYAGACYYSCVRHVLRGVYDVIFKNVAA